MLRKVLQSGIDYPQSCSFSRKLFQFVLPVILEGGNHLNVSQQLIQLISVLDQYGLVQYCAKVIQTKIVEFRYLFFRNFIELSYESSWKFSPALRVISPEQRAIFLRKFAIKSLWKTKQFTARHARSLCRVLSTKNGFKGSCELRSSCFD